MFYGLLNLSFWGYFIVFMAFTQFTIMCVTLYLHRSQAHRSVDFHPAISHIFRFWTWVTTGMGTKMWTAVHRKHHAKCETVEDPHSPQVLGIKTVLWKGAELYRRASTDQETLDKYGHGTPDDWIERHVYTKYSSLGYYLLLVFEILFLGVPGIAIWAVQMMWIPFFAAGVVNGLGHYWGYRNFECNDASTNLSPWGVFIGGEELHNNHHTYPTSAKFSIKSWEFDIGWFYLKIFQALGLAKIKRVAPVVQNVPGKALDLDTVRQLIHNRFQVMTRYTKSVVLPALEEEKSRISSTDWKLIKRLKGALVREPSLVDGSSLASLKSVLKQHQHLQQVYEFRERLRTIWDQTAVTPKELLEAVQEWCKEAEASGVKALKDFSNYIKTYHLVTA